ncbi:MAG: winged helix-turn-helix domain-containing protein [Methanomassiliicoccales archaeon]|nr:winged helix-turn-helix domain-containing protein [Methanomassiliicoccales archaeon]
MTDANEELMRKIEELRREMDSIHRSVSSLRYDGMTAAFREQIGGSFLNLNREAFRAAMGQEDARSSQSKEALSQLSAIYDDAMSCFERDDPNRGIDRLEELRPLLSEASVPVIGPDLARVLSAVVKRARDQMAMMETLRFRVGRPMLRRSCESAFGGLEPEDLEILLAPLSNATRLKIMALLYISPRSFTEMSQEIGLQKGHMQFHLRKLVDAGYVKVDRRTHLYSIEEKGFVAIDGLGRLFSRL